MGNQWTMNNGKLTMSHENLVPRVAEFVKNHKPIDDAALVILVQ